MAQRAPTNRPQADVEQVHNQARFQQSGVPDFGTASPQMLNIPDVKLDTTNIQINRQQIAESKQDLKVLGSALAKQEAVNLTTDIYSKVFLQTDAYLKANPSGQGLADTMMDLHQQLTNQAIDSASSSESIQLIRMVSAEQKQHLMPALYNKEKDTSFKFLLNETEKSKNVIESQLLAHPDQAVALKEQYLLNMEPIRKANPQAFLEVQKHWLRDFDMTHFSGTNYQSPWAARELIGKLNNVTAEDRKKMYHHVDTRIESLRKQQRRLEKANEKVRKYNEDIEATRIEKLILLDKATEDTIEHANVSQLRKEKLGNELIRHQITQGNKTAAVNKALDNIQNNISNRDATKKTLETVYLEEIRQMEQNVAAENETLDPTQQKKVTALDKFIQADSIRGKHPIDPIAMDFSNTILQGAPMDAFETAIAVNYGEKHNPTILKNMDPLAKAGAFFIATKCIQGDDVKKIANVVEEFRTMAKNLEKVDTQKLQKEYNQYAKNQALTGWSELKALFSVPDDGRSRAHVESIRQQGYFLGMRGDVLKKYTIESFSNMYKQTNIARVPGKLWGTNKMPMYLAPEILFPEDRDSPRLRNEYFRSVEDAIKAYKHTGVQSVSPDITLVEPITNRNLLKNKTEEEKRKILENQDITVSHNPKINVTIKGKQEVRELYPLKDPGDNKFYNVYYLLDESNPNTKVPLYGPNSSLPLRVGFE